MFAERCEGEYGIENVERFTMMRMEDYTTMASRADVYTSSASASNVSVYTNTICIAKYLLGTPKPLNCIRWMQTVRLHR